MVWQQPENTSLSPLLSVPGETMVVCKMPQMQASSGILESSNYSRGGQGLQHAAAWRTPIQTSHGRRYRQFCANQELPVPRRFSLSSQPLLSQSVSIFTLSTHYTSTLSTPFLGISKNERKRQCCFTVHGGFPWTSHSKELLWAAVRSTSQLPWISAPWLAHSGQSQAIFFFLSDRA